MTSLVALARCFVDTHKAGPRPAYLMNNASTKSAAFVAHVATRAMLRGERTVIPGLFNKLSCFGVRFMSRRLASRVAKQVLGKPRFALPGRSAS